MEGVTQQQRDRLSNIFLAMLKDNDYRVRLCISKAVIVLFQLYSEHRTIYQDIQKELHPFLSSKGNDGASQFKIFAPN
jgi:hypothetical protein